MIDIIVPVWNLLEKNKLFIKSLEGQDDFNLIIIDNASGEDTKVFFSEIGDIINNVRIITNKENLGYVKAINQGLEVSRSPFVLFANNDIILSNRLLISLKEALDKFDVVAPLTNNSGNRKDVRLVSFSQYPTFESINNFALLLNKSGSNIEEVDFVYGHCMMVKREVINKIGFLDESFGIGNYDDVDFCKRAKDFGFKIGLCRNLFVYHFCHSTFNELGLDVNKIILENAERYKNKWNREKYL